MIRHSHAEWDGSGTKFHVNVRLISGIPKLGKCPRLQLPDPFLRDTHFLANLLESQRFLSTLQPETRRDNFLLTVIQPIQDL